MYSNRKNRSVANKMTIEFSELLKESTKKVHRIVETKQIMKSLMKGTLSLDSYCHLLSGLHKIYSILEKCLDLHSNHPILSQFHFKELYRSKALERDLLFFNYSKTCNCKAVDSIVSRIQNISESDPEKLIAYSYTRYLGDLSGGVFLQKRIIKVYNLVQDSKGSEFYQFPGIEDGGYFKKLYRMRLNEIPIDFQQGILDETILAFEFHGPLFDEMLFDCKQSCLIIDENVVEKFRSLGIKHTHLNVMMGIFVILLGLLFKI